MIEHIVPSYSLDILALILTAAGNLQFKNTNQMSACAFSDFETNGTLESLDELDKLLDRKRKKHAYCKMVG